MSTAISQALISTFKHTHTYKDHKYQKLGYATMKDRETGKWLSGILYRTESGELCVREQFDFFAKFETQLSDAEKAQARAALGPDPVEGE